MLVYRIIFLVFLSASLLVFGLYRYLSVDKRTQKLLNARLEAIQNSDDANLAIELQRNKRGLWLLQKKSKYKGINKWLIQTGLELDMVFVIKIAVTVAMISVIGYVMTGLSLNGLLEGLLLSLILVYIFLSRSRKNRIAKFEEQLPDALDIIVRSLRAGHPTQTAISLASRECADPIGSEFGYASDEIRHGLDISSALRNMSYRVGLPDLIYVEAAISVQTQSGGSLSNVIANLAKIIRERFKLRQKISALTSEGRMSGIVLTALPIAIAAVVMFINPSYYLEVYDEPLFSKAVILAGVLLVMGHLWIQNMLKFRS